MLIHLVGGFLGSGKTTAILQACRLLMRRGVTVGVVTNDQGRNLVDTAFLRASGAATSEVSGGCFCCNLPDFERRLSELSAASAPQVVFAEPVGSCTDLVATIMKPLAIRGPTDRVIRSLSVLADIRLLRRRLQGSPLPFSSDVLYILDTQLEEADIIILNKSDLLPPEVARDVLARAVSRFAGKRVILQNSLDPRNVDAWLDIIDEGSPSSARSVAVDYQRYADGEMRLAWYDASILLDTVPDGREAVRILMAEIRAAAGTMKGPAAHIKLLVEHGDGVFKGSLTTADDLPAEIPPVRGPVLKVIVNARVEADAEELKSAMRTALQRVAARPELGLRIIEEQSFHPSPPVPFQRIP
jgi:Ni2+-binding GTPase involved in maturation of urease and hydrogenase